MASAIVATVGDTKSRMILSHCKVLMSHLMTQTVIDFNVLRMPVAWKLVGKHNLTYERVAGGTFTMPIEEGPEELRSAFLGISKGDVIALFEFLQRTGRWSRDDPPGNQFRKETFW